MKNIRELLNFDLGKINGKNLHFKFNAKEYDAETGNYYYEARYYDPKWSTFLTPDPALKSYPGISPYAYTLNNPIRYVDPTGMYMEDSKDPPVEIDGGPLNPVHIIANSSGTNLTSIGYLKADFKVRVEIIRDGGPIATALISAENKGLYRPLIDALTPNASPLGRSFYTIPNYFAVYYIQIYKK